MLVLTRKIGERIKVGDAWVTLVDIHNFQVRLGIDAPKDVMISREELLDEGERYEATKNDARRG